MTIHAFAHLQHGPFGVGRMAGLTLLRSVQMDAMAEEDIAGYLIHADPGYRAAGLGELRQLLNGWFILGNRDVTGHAFCRRRKRDVLTGIWILVTVGASQRYRQMGLMAEGQRLYDVGEGRGAKQENSE